MIKWVNPAIGREETEAATRVLRSGSLTCGDRCREFENLLCKVAGANYVVAVSSGTAALHCAIKALEMRFGKLTVAVPSFSYIATTNSVIANNHKLCLTDSELRTWNIDASKIPSSCNVLLPVDVGGLPCDHDALKDLGTFILEDASEALGAEYNHKPVGGFADLTVFSFHASKIVTSGGEGGAVVTNDYALYNMINQFKSQGNSPHKTQWEYRHGMVGFNYRMTELQAAIGIEQLKKLPVFLEKRKRLVKLYRELLGDLVVYQETPSDRVHSNWLFAVLLRDYRLREDLCRYLWSKGIEVRVTWKPIHLQPAYLRFRSQSLPVAEVLGNSVVSLPLNNKTTEQEVTIVVDEVKKFLRSHS